MIVMSRENKIAPSNFPQKMIKDIFLGGSAPCASFFPIRLKKPNDVETIELKIINIKNNFFFILNSFNVAHKSQAV